jgi:predicted dehydrogenase
VNQRLERRAQRAAVLGQPVLDPRWHLRIHGAHHEAVGPLRATLATRQRGVRVTDDDTRLVPTAPDQVAVQGTFAGGAMVSVHYRNGIARSDALRWTIHGSEGELRVTGTSGNLQTAALELAGARGDDPALQPIEVAAQLAAVPPGPPLAVAHQYAAIARSLRRDSVEYLPDFAYAVRRHHQIDRLIAAAQR